MQSNSCFIYLDNPTILFLIQIDSARFETGEMKQYDPEKTVVVGGDRLRLYAMEQVISCPQHVGDLIFP